MSTTKYDWSGVDWNLPAKEIARQVGCSYGTVVLKRPYREAHNLDDKRVPSKRQNHLQTANDLDVVMASQVLQEAISTLAIRVNCPNDPKAHNERARKTIAVARVWERLRDDTDIPPLSSTTLEKIINEVVDRYTSHHAGQNKGRN